MNLKEPESIAAVLDLVANADMLIEGFRPGVMERLGLGPDECSHLLARFITPAMMARHPLHPLQWSAMLEVAR